MADDVNLELESYKEGNAYGRTIHDSHYKLAGISFTFNALLVTGLGLVMQEKFSPDFQHAIGWIIYSIAVFGMVFNAGALAAFRFSWRTWFEIHKVLREFEERHDPDLTPPPHSPMLQIQRAMKKDAGEMHGLVYGLTCGFFGLFIVGWGMCFFLTEPPWK